MCQSVIENLRHTSTFGFKGRLCLFEVPVYIEFTIFTRLIECGHGALTHEAARGEGLDILL